MLNVKGTSKKGGKRKRRREAPPSERAFTVPSFLAFFTLGILLAAGASGILHAFRSGPAEAPPRPRPAAAPAPAAGKGTAGVNRERAEEVFQRGYAHLSNERYGEAVRDFEEAARLDPTDPRPHVGLAKIHQALDYDERAEQAYRKAIALDPTFDDAKVFLAQILCDFGRNEEALGLLEEVARRAREDSIVWAEIAVNQMRLGYPEKAIPLLERYDRAAGRQAWGPMNLGRALADVGRIDEAEKAYREALAIDPKISLAYLWLGQLLMAKGRREEAEPLLRTYRELRTLHTEEHQLNLAVSRGSEDPRVFVNVLVRLAQVRHLLGKEREAVIPLRWALEYAPGDAKLRKLFEDQARRAGISPR
ncbi:MAG: tetratricopeptide repeat protein [Planctomycetes bacterium]|nr:tetratricopeptide repeat protein [Planctomycetota bacterium]